MSQASDMVTAYTEAEQAVLKGQTYRFGDRQLTRADLAEIRNGRREWERRLVAERRAARRGPAIARFDE